MGAEGSIVVMHRTLWDERWPEVHPAEVGFYTGTILGVEAVWDYYGENTDYEMRTELFIDTELTREIVEWFRATAECHEVWT